MDLMILKIRTDDELYFSQRVFLTLSQLQLVRVAKMGPHHHDMLHVSTLPHWHRFRALTTR